MAKEKICKRIQNLASNIIQKKINDPRVKLVTVTQVDMTDDLRYCTIYVSIMGTDAQVRTAMRGLQHARGYIQSQIVPHLDLRNAPVIRIEKDDVLEKQRKMSDLIDAALRGETAKDEEE